MFFWRLAILNVPLPISVIDKPSHLEGILSACLHFLISTSLYKNESRISNFQSYLEGKLSVTLQSRNLDYVSDLQFPVSWFHSLYTCLKEISPFVRTCWLRTAAGGWTTSIRMHSDVLLCRCMFGCIDSEDVLTHYLCCPILWCLAREISGINETDVSIISRLSIQDPSKDKLVLLAFCHVLYHCAINDRECIKLHFDDDQSSLQRRVVSLGRQIKHMLSVD